MHWVIIFYLSVTVVFMAVLIWLTVRVINRRERWAKWSLAATLSMPILYLASWPAMAWLGIHGFIPDAIGQWLAIVYYPAGFTVNGNPSPGWVRDVMIWYLGIWFGDSPTPILIPALSVAFTAACVWLTVRVVNRRERWAKWTLAVLISLPLIYVLSGRVRAHIRHQAPAPATGNRLVVHESGIWPGADTYQLDQPP